jgi:hypothetical protein
MYPVDDPQALRNPRPDVSYYQAGMTGLKIKTQGEVASSNVLAFGTPSEGSRMIWWGWNPVGGASSFDTVLTPNYLILPIQIGTVTTS